MSSATPKKGDRIRVTDEGTVVTVNLATNGVFGRTRLTVKRDDGSLFHTTAISTIEVIEQPLVVGGVYMDKDGDVFRYNGPGDYKASWTEFSENYDGGEKDWGAGYPAKPLRRLDAAR